MRMKMTIATLLAVLAIGAYTGFGAVTVNWSFLSEDGVFVDNFGAPLSAGDPAVAGDGTIVQLLAWVGAPGGWGTKEPDWDFADWIDNLVDPNYVEIAKATVGDGMQTFPPALAPGRLALATTFDPVAPVDIQGAQMVMRFFDATTLWYNELSQAAWLVPLDGLPPVSIDVAVGPTQDLATLLGNPMGVDGKQADNYATALLVPEPGTILLLGAGLGVLLRRKRG